MHGSTTTVGHFPPPGEAPERHITATVWRVFWAWTAFFWGGTVVLGALFYVGVIDFPTSTRLGLYGTSVWLNAWLIPFLLPGAGRRDATHKWHEAIVIWMICYTMTNALWEIPWVLSSPFIFEDMHTLTDVVDQSAWMRESPLHMGWWVMASFASVDLRTVNHDATFYALEFFSFANVAGTIAFYRLNARRSALRYLIPVLGGGEPVAATFIFSFSEVFAHFENMPGGVADTLLALVWTQYQYLVFPIIFGVVGSKLLFGDLYHGWFNAREETDG
ncbi:MAG: hypothetical protein CMH57_04990 [Myxococcales bacterium]|nr:hypothetical protein [Myxococcales bacterium]